jgi:hypothetical protein
MRVEFWFGVFAVLGLAGCHSSYEPAKREASPADAVTPGSPDAPPSADDPHAGLFAAAGADDPHAELFVAAPAADLGPEVTAGSIRLTAPDGWVRKQPRSQFVEAEFALPKAEGDTSDGRLTISLAGGSVKDNVSRWRDQFGGKPEKDAQQDLEIAGRKVTVVDFVGTYADQPGPFAPAVERPGYRMLAAIVPVGEQLHFIKAYGPQKTMTDHEDAFHAFLRSLKGK